MIIENKNEWERELVYMTEMELFNILDKIGIDANSERFTQESFEYDNPFYEFDEYVNKN